MNDITETHEPTAADVKQAALAMGMPEKTAKKRRAKLAAVATHMDSEYIRNNQSDLDLIHDRSAVRANNRPSRAALIAGGVATGAVLAIGAMNGMFNEADDVKKLAEYDANNKDANIANNPDLFGQDLPENPSDMTVVVKPTPETNSSEDNR